MSVILELAATGLLFSICWSISKKAINDFPIREICLVYVLRVPVQILAQVFFGYRSWSLLGKRRLLREIWTALILFELVLGELTLFYSYSRWSLEDPRPWPVGREYTLRLDLAL